MNLQEQLESLLNDARQDDADPAALGSKALNWVRMAAPQIMSALNDQRRIDFLARAQQKWTLTIFPPEVVSGDASVPHGEGVTVETVYRPLVDATIRFSEKKTNYDISEALNTLPDDVE